ncbi:GNAT family N-acetyltransferase [Roseateles sp. BYS96W]|uniref:GNAT family N-acetyltransferase n=1 Tax=Pelomonas nitida TaxID=3299027 RepID=A0ABW7G383_9BURK
MEYQLRPTGPGDDAWQLAIYASTRTEELALTGWPRAQCDAFVAQQHRAQQQHYWRHYPRSLCQLILVDGAVAGRLWVDSRADRLHVLDISLLPAFRDRGLGTRCLLNLAKEAAATDRPLGIQVEVHNPARRLYERLGFAADGEAQGLYQPMLRPVTAAPIEACLP